MKSEAERKERSSFPKTYPIKRKLPDLSGERNWVTFRAEGESPALVQTLSPPDVEIQHTSRKGEEKTGDSEGIAVVLPISPVELLTLIRALQF